MRSSLYSKVLFTACIALALASCAKPKSGFNAEEVSVLENSTFSPGEKISVPSFEAESMAVASSDSDSSARNASDGGFIGQSGSGSAGGDGGFIGNPNAPQPTTPVVVTPAPTTPVVVVPPVSTTPVVAQSGGSSSTPSNSSSSSSSSSSSTPSNSSSSSSSSSPSVGGSDSGYIGQTTPSGSDSGNVPPSNSGSTPVVVGNNGSSNPSTNPSGSTTTPSGSSNPSPSDSNSGQQASNTNPINPGSSNGSNPTGSATTPSGSDGGYIGQNTPSGNDGGNVNPSNGNTTPSNGSTTPIVNNGSTPTTPIVQNPDPTNGSSNPSTPVTPGNTNPDGNSPTTPIAGNDNGNVPQPPQSGGGDHGTTPATPGSTASNPVVPSVPVVPVTPPAQPTTPPIIAGGNPIIPIIQPIIDKVIEIVTGTTPTTPDHGNIPVVPSNPPTDGGSVPPSTPTTPIVHVPTPTPATPVVVVPPVVIPPVVPPVVVPNPTPVIPPVVVVPTPTPTPGVIPDTRIPIDIARVCSKQRSQVAYPRFVFFEESKRPILSMESMSTAVYAECQKVDSLIGNLNFDISGTYCGMRAPSTTLVTKADLKGLNMIAAARKIEVAYNKADVKNKIGAGWKNQVVAVTVCDDTNNNGKCSDEKPSNILSILPPSYYMKKIPAKLDIAVWSGRSFTEANNADKCDIQYSPLLLDLTGQGFKLDGPADGVYFDLNATGRKVVTGWPSENNMGFLVRDLDKDRGITSGAELFGNATMLKNGTRAANGFEALKDLDENHDGIFNRLDPAWATVKVWIDKNHNGLSERRELYTLNDLDIDSINLNYATVFEVDAYGNQTKQRSTYKRTLNAQMNIFQIIDVWFQTLASQDEE